MCVCVFVCVCVCVCVYVCVYCSALLFCCVHSDITLYALHLPFSEYIQYTSPFEAGSRPVFIAITLNSLFFNELISNTLNITIKKENKNKYFSFLSNYTIEKKRTFLFKNWCLQIAAKHNKIISKNVFFCTCNNILFYRNYITIYINVITYFFLLKHGLFLGSGISIILLSSY